MRFEDWKKPAMTLAALGIVGFAGLCLLGGENKQAVSVIVAQRPGGPNRPVESPEARPVKPGPVVQPVMDRSPRPVPVETSISRPPRPRPNEKPIPKKILRPGC